MTSYNNACMEVSTILRYLDTEEYNKIPKDVIEVIEKNKNTEYIFEIDKNVDLKEQKLLKETKAILFNLFRDYLSTPKQKEIIIKMQREERNKRNEIKKQKYFNTSIFKKQKHKKYEKTNNDIRDIIKVEEDNLFLRIVNKIKNFFKIH